MANFQLRSKSLSESRKLFEAIGSKAWHIRTRTNRISPHITITFSSSLSIADLRNMIAEYSTDNLMTSSLRKDRREVLLV